MPAIATETLAPPRMAVLNVGGNVYHNNSIFFSPETAANQLICYTTNFANTAINSSIGIGIGGGYDVTDNKTNELSLFTKHIYRMNDIFHREDERVKTFDNWPIEWLDKFELARTGMFYTGEADKVKCYFCEVEIGRWEEQDSPVPEHLRWSPNCPLLKRRTTNNVPIDVEALDRALPPVSYDICGANDAIEVRPFAYAEGTINMTATRPAASTGGAIATTTSSSCSTTSSAPTNYFPEFPEYAIEAARQRSFAEWPRHMKQKPDQLSEAGFFYTGVGDRVKCFSCGGGLKDWDANDEPWEQHALWLNKCRYLNLIKGQSYIESVIAKHKAAEAAEVAAAAAVEKPLEAIEELPKPFCAVSNDLTTATTINCDVASAPVDALAKDASAAAAVPEQTQQQAQAQAEKKVLASHLSIPEEKLCKICYAGEYNTAFLPCGHVVACAKCASSVTKCPLCRKPFTDVMRVYFS